MLKWTSDIIAFPLLLLTACFHPFQGHSLYTKHRKAGESQIFKREVVHCTLDMRPFALCCCLIIILEVAGRSFSQCFREIDCSGDRIHEVGQRDCCIKTSDGVSYNDGTTCSQCIGEFSILSYLCKKLKSYFIYSICSSWVSPVTIYCS